MTDAFGLATHGVEKLQYGRAEAVDISATDHQFVGGSARCLYIGTAGIVGIQTIDGQSLTLNGAVAGAILPIFVKKVYKDTTTAKNIVGLS